MFLKYGEQSTYKNWFHIRKFPLIENDFDPLTQPGGLNYDAFRIRSKYAQVKHQKILKLSTIS